jgi:molecular chaperone DnaK
MPAVRAFFEEVCGRSAERGVDPMECVACGAAIQAGVLTGEMGDIVLIDVTPLTLGVETLGGIATSLIARNTPIPIKRAELFTTAADMQTSVTVHIFQGERPMAADNTSLGQFTLDGLPPAPRGIPKIEITFDIDASGILDVTAKDTATGKSQSLRITGSTRLSEEEKRRMIEGAERYAEEDRRRRQQAEQLNAADAVCYQAERLIADFAAKLTNEQRQGIESALRETREAVAKRDAGSATAHAESLKRLLQEAGSAMYAQSPQAGPQPRPEAGAATGEARPTGPGPSGRVVDAQYREARKG